VTLAPLDLSPRPGSASLFTMVRAQALMEARLLLRNGEQLVLALAIPLLMLIGGQEAAGLVELGPGRRIDVLTPGVLALAVLSTSFTSVAIATGFERRYGVLKLLGASPLTRTGLLAGKVGAVLLVQTLQLSVLCAVAYGLGWDPSGGLPALLGGVLLVLLATAAFGALGLLMAGTLRAEATLAGANLLYLLLVAGGAILVPLASYPEAAQPLLRLLPTGAFAEGLRQVCSGAGLGVRPVAVLVAWALVAGLATARTFRWE
jgi:ABC-2 type transport system permease protein